MARDKNLSRKDKRKRTKRKILISTVLISLILITGAFAFTLHQSKNTKIIVSTNDVPIIKNKSNFYDKKNSVPSTDDDLREEIIISATGDVLIGTDPRFQYHDTLVNTFYDKGNDYSYFMKNVRDIFEADDVTIVDLENPLTDSTDMLDKQYSFKGPKNFAKILSEGNIEAVNISNNHIYDFNKRGFMDTINSLEENDVNYFGENNIWRTEIKGIKLGFLGYPGWSYDSTTLKKIKNDIEMLKKENRVVIINFHWGDEREYYPNDIQKYLAKYSIDNGADLIVSQHPHVVQGIEIYKDKVIAYSLGNFCFGGNRNPSDKRTFILQVKFIFENSKLKDTAVRVIPCNISSVKEKNNYQPTPMAGDEKSDFFKFINEISPADNLNLSDEFYYLTKFINSKNVEQ
jgi:poly-gamma-glutamate synthesis protein (capsule biosynthesis protein)